MMSWFSRTYKFFKQDLFQGKSTKTDRFIFRLFGILNEVGKFLSPKLFKDWFYGKLMDYILQPLPNYEVSDMVEGTDEERKLFMEYKKRRFLEVARPGDVILVKGNQIVSRIIQTLTHSPYSHSAYYRGNGELIEVEPEGVIVVSIDKYLAQDIRICRPSMISDEAKEKVRAYIEEMLVKQAKYDLANIEKLLFKYWYSKFRPDLKMYIGGSTRFERYYLCSGMIAHAFHKAGYPISPTKRFYRHKHQKLEQLTKVDDYFQWVAHSPQNYSQIVPADFDNSSFFTSIKFLFSDGVVPTQGRELHWEE